MTYREALNLLPKQYRDAAIRNGENRPHAYIGNIDTDIPEVFLEKNIVSYALIKAFTWENSPEGDQYCRKLYKQINVSNYNV